MTQQHFGKDYGGNVPQNYEKFFVPAIGGPAANGLVKIAALRPGERVLDVACGTGIVARLASEAVGNSGTVSGLDINPGMLAVARSATPAGMEIEWHEASADSMPFPESSFDAVLCQMGLQFMPDKHAALNEMRRVLAPGGRLILNMPGPTPELFLIMGEAFEHHVGTEAAGFVKQVFSLYDTEEIQSLLHDAGFSNILVQANTKSLPVPPPEEFLWQYVYSTPLAGAVAQLNDEGREALESDVLSKWQDFMKDNALMLQVRMVVATARK